MHFKYLFKFLFGRSPFVLEKYGLRFIVRPRSYSLYIINEIFGAKDYEPRFFDPKKVDTVVDLGACTGEFSLWAVQRFGPKKVIAVEMEEQNFQTLEKNFSLNKLKKVVRQIHGAVYSKNTEISFKESTFNLGMHRIGIDGSENVRAYTLKEILDLARIQKVDFLKIDIEGSERFVLTKDNEDLFKKRVKFVVMESHGIGGFDKYFPVKYFSNLGFRVAVRRQLFKRPIMVEVLNSTL